jgi:hypothetical protein
MPRDAITRITDAVVVTLGLLLLVVLLLARSC